MRGSGLKIIAEPGRVIVGNAGVLVTKVLYLKETDVKRFIVVDAAMNDLIRPVLYEAYHAIIPVKKAHRAEDRHRRRGRSGMRERRLPRARARDCRSRAHGDLLAVMSAGAYGAVMSSNYNSRPRVPEILVDGADAHVIRERETFEDLIRGEKMVDLKTR